MNIAVTGASGFIGTELLRYIADKGYSVNGRTVHITGLTRKTADDAAVDDACERTADRDVGSNDAAAAACERTADREGDSSDAADAANKEICAESEPNVLCSDTNGSITWRSTDYSVGSLTEALDGVDAVIHLAGVRGTTSDPDDYAANELMTENILKAMDAAGVRRIVFASTISVYDDVDLIPWTEGSPLKGRTMYGCSKIRCEELIRKYSGEAGFSYAIVRIAQVLGLGERRRGMMNVFLDTAKAGGEIKVIGRSEAKRQYIYVKDLARILAELAAAAGSSNSDKNGIGCGDLSPEAKPEKNSGIDSDQSFEAKTAENMGSRSITVNAGMPAAYTNLEIAQIVNKVYGNATPIEYDDSKPETIKSSFMNITGLKDELGFTPMDMVEAISCIRKEHSTVC